MGKNHPRKNVSCSRLNSTDASPVPENSFSLNKVNPISTPKRGHPHLLSSMLLLICILELQWIAAKEIAANPHKGKIKYITEKVNRLSRLAHPHFWAKPRARRGGRFLRTPRRWFLPGAGGLQPGSSAALRSRLPLRKDTGWPPKNPFPPGFLIHRPPRRAILARENWGWARLSRSAPAISLDPQWPFQYTPNSKNRVPIKR